MVTVTHDAGDGGAVALAGAKPVINLAGLGTMTVNTCAEAPPAPGLDGDDHLGPARDEHGQRHLRGGSGRGLYQPGGPGQELWVDYRLVVSPEEAGQPGQHHPHLQGDP